MATHNDAFAAGLPAGRHAPIASIRNSASFVVEAMRRLRAANRIRTKSLFLIALVALISAVACGTQLNPAAPDRNPLAIAIPIFAVFFSVFALLIPIFWLGNRVDEWNVARAFKKTPLHDVELTIEFGDSGLRSHSRIAESFVRWELFKKAVHFGDGLLLFEEMNFAHWIPRSSFADPVEWSEARAIVERAVTEHIYLNERRVSDDLESDGT